MSPGGFNPFNGTLKKNGLMFEAVLIRNQSY